MNGRTDSDVRQKAIAALQKLPPFKRIDHGLLLYYRSIGPADYVNLDGIGLFKRWCNRNDYDDADEDDVAAELADGNVENCAYLEFTHDFPFGDDMENANKTEKRLAQFKIMQHCYRYGVPPPHIEHKHAWDFDDIDPNNPMRTFKSASKERAQRFVIKLDKPTENALLELQSSYESQIRLLEQERLENIERAKRRRRSSSHSSHGTNRHFPNHYSSSPYMMDSTNQYESKTEEFVPSDPISDPVSDPISEPISEPNSNHFLNAVAADPSTYCDLNALDRVIGEYYNAMNSKDYYDDDGIGKFMKWFTTNEHDEDDLEEQLADGNEADCEYIEFDDAFPLPLHMEPNRKIKQFEIMQYIFRTGTYTVFAEEQKINSVDINQIDMKEMAKNQMNISMDIDEDTMQRVSELYDKTCPTIWNMMRKSCGDKEEDQGMITGLAVGHKHNIPFLQYLVDTYQRDKSQRILSNPKDSPLTVSRWCALSPFVKKISERADGAKKVKMIEHAMSSYMKRVQPEWTAEPTTFTIKDDIFEIARLYNATACFVSGIHRTIEHVDTACMPFQCDFSIAVRDMTSKVKSQYVVPELSDTESSGSDDEVQDSPNASDTYFDMIGDVGDKLNENGLKWTSAVLQNPKERTDDAFKLPRLIADNFKHFIETNGLKGDDGSYPRNKRFISIVDRRANITTFTGKGKNIKLSTKPRDQKENDIVFFEPPSDSRDIPHEPVPEVFNNHLIQSLIPNYGYRSDSILSMHHNIGNWDEQKDGHKKQMVTSHINGPTPCHGALLTFSFHVVQDDEIRVYLWREGKCMRFLPSDFMDVLPTFFDSEYKSNGRFKESSEVRSIMHNFPCRDRHFEKWFIRMSIQEQPELNLHKYELSEEELKEYTTTGMINGKKL